MQAEIIALRHQLIVLQRTQKPKRVVLKPGDRCIWVWLSRVWSAWRSALIIVKPETVIGWHRQGFRLYWTWKVRHGRSGRPKVPKQTRDLIRTMSRENPLWGAPRIHSERSCQRGWSSISASASSQPSAAHSSPFFTSRTIARITWPAANNVQASSPPTLPVIPVIAYTIVLL